MRRQWPVMGPAAGFIVRLDREFRRACVCHPLMLRGRIRQTRPMGGIGKNPEYLVADPLISGTLLIQPNVKRSGR